MESITFNPVINGWYTDFLVMTPGATLSIGRDLLLTIGSPPSTASPSAFTTLPSNASPTGTSTILPVRFTSSPSRIKVS